MSASLVGEFYVECDVFLPGDYFYDLIYTGLPEFPTLGREVYGTGILATGGAMFITAASLRRLGVRVGWAACFGNDEYSQYVRRLAVEEDVDLNLAQDVDRPYRRVTTAISCQGERAFVTYVDPPPIDIEAHWRRGMAASPPGQALPPSPEAVSRGSLWKACGGTRAGNARIFRTS